MTTRETENCQQKGSEMKSDGEKGEKEQKSNEKISLLISLFSGAPAEVNSRKTHKS